MNTYKVEYHSPNHQKEDIILKNNIALKGLNACV